MKSAAQKPRQSCSEVRWLEAAERSAAIFPGLAGHQIFESSRQELPRVARWSAWWALKEEGYSTNSIASASGFDHASVRYAFQQMEKW